LLTAWLAVGLGNPGKSYERTRHNAGVRAIERLADNLGVKLRASKTRALVGDARTDGAHLLIARPTTFMNESGAAVADLIRWFKVAPDRLIVVHDDIDLKSSVLRLKRGGGTAGHHGLDSIVAAIGTRDFYRVRIGVGRTRIPETPDRVLERVSKKEREDLGVAESNAAEAVLSIIKEGLDRAMNRFNTR
jgi:PTH1 family peptidyl-tRNA hydrolase